MKKFIAKTLAIVLSLCLGATLTACGGGKASTTVTLDKQSISLTVGDKQTLTATVTPEGSAVAFASDKPEIASVDATGSVTAHKAGVAKVTATADGVSAECTVNVSSTGLVAPARKIYYKDAPEADLTGGKIVRTKADGTTENISLSAGGVTLKTFDTSTLGDSQIVVTFEGKDYAFGITVKDKIMSTGMVRDENYFSSYPYTALEGATAVMTEKGLEVKKAADQTWGGVRLNIFGTADTYAVVVKVFSEADGIALSSGFADIYSLITEVKPGEPGYDNYLPHADGKWKQNGILQGSGGSFAGATSGTFLTAYRLWAGEQTDNLEGPYGWNANTARFNDKIHEGVVMPFDVKMDCAKENTGSIVIEDIYYLTKAEYEVAKSMTIESAPDKSIYLIGEDNLDLTGGKLKLTNVYGDSFRTIDMTDAAVTVSGFDTTVAADTQTITVTYMGISKTFDISVKDYKAVTLSTIPTGKTYKNASKPNLKGGVITATKGDDSTEELQLTSLAAIVEVTQFDATAVGNTTVKFMLYGQEFSYQTAVADNVLTTANLLDQDYLDYCNIQNGLNSSFELTADGLKINIGESWEGGVIFDLYAPAGFNAIRVKAKGPEGKSVAAVIAAKNGMVAKYQGSWRNAAFPASGELEFDMIFDPASDNTGFYADDADKTAGIGGSALAELMRGGEMTRFTLKADDVNLNITIVEISFVTVTIGG